MRGKTRTLKWFLIMILILGMMGTSYAAYSNTLFGDYHFESSLLNFIFDDSDNGRSVSVEYQIGEKGPLQELDSSANYDGKQLTISDIGPLDAEMLADGNLTLFIHYTIRTEQEDQGIQQAKTVYEEEEPGYYIGEVDFQRNTDTPIWELENDGQCWGTGSVGGTPAVLYGFLPERLCQFDAYNQIEKTDRDGLMNGTIILKQKTVPHLSQWSEINLSSLELDPDVVEQIKCGSLKSSLTIEGSYGFQIPVDLDQFNIEKGF